jgi:hypothetical protein
VADVHPSRQASRDPLAAFSPVILSPFLSAELLFTRRAARNRSPSIASRPAATR